MNKNEEMSEKMHLQYERYVERCKRNDVEPEDFEYWLDNMDGIPYGVV